MGNFGETNVLRQFFCVAILTALIGPALAQSGDWASDEFSRARLIAAEDSVGPEGTLTLGLEIELAPGWKTYWRSPGEGGLPPAFDWSPSNNVTAGVVSWPQPHRATTYGLDNFVYTERVILPITAQVDNPAEAANLHLHLDYAVCSDLCVPVRAELALRLPSRDGAQGAHGAAIKAALAQVPVMAGEASDVSIISAKPVVEGEKSFLDLHTRGYPAEEPSADIFIEAGYDFLFGRPEVTRLSGMDDYYRIRLPITYGTADKLSGQSISITLAGPKPVESTVKVGPVS